MKASDIEVGKIYFVTGDAADAVFQQQVLAVDIQDVRVVSKHQGDTWHDAPSSFVGLVPEPLINREEIEGVETPCKSWWKKLFGGAK